MCVYEYWTKIYFKMNLLKNLTYQAMYLSVDT